MIIAMSNAIIVGGAVVLGAIIVAILVFKAMWRVAEPNEALIISGLREKGIAKDASGDEMGFRIVTGKGTLVLPGVQAVRRLSLDLHEAGRPAHRLLRRASDEALERQPTRPMAHSSGPHPVLGAGRQ